MKYLESKKYNVIVTVATSLICLVFFLKSGVLDNAGMAAIILNWLPIVVGLVTIIIYFIADAISNKYGWVVTVLGNLFNIVLVFRAFWNA